MKPLKAIFLFTVVILTGACSGGGGGGSSTANSQSIGGVSGTYIDAFKNLTTGDCYVDSYNFNNGSFEADMYYFKGCNQSAAFTRFSGTYTVSGNVYTPSFTYETCPAPNGITETYNITQASASAISVDISYSAPINGISNLQVVMNQETSLQNYLSSIGMVAAVEDTSCTLIPGVN